MIVCDTSTIAKLYVQELESEAVRKALEADEQACASELARIELMGVFHRRLREGKWTRDEFLAAAHQFSADDLGGFWTWFPIDAAICEAAAISFTTLPETVFLRSADCLHLVTALHHKFDEIHTHDRHQMAAAPSFGIKPVAIRS